jgi:hypothetical protein
MLTRDYAISLGRRKLGYTDELSNSGLLRSVLAHSNTGSKSKDSRFKLLQLLDYSGVNQATTTTTSTNASLWGDESVFTFASYQNEFALTGTMNNGYPFPYKISFTSLDHGDVTVSLETI